MLSARNISVRFEPNKEVKITIGEISALSHSWENVAISCASLDMTNDAIRCTQGNFIAADFKANLEITFRPTTKRLDVVIKAPQLEQWHLAANLNKEHWQVDLQISRAQVKRFAAFIPEQYVRPTAGIVSGNIKVVGTNEVVNSLDSNLSIVEISASDKSGLHAVEKLAGLIAISANRSNTNVMHWKTKLGWDKGEVFWAPIYIPSGGHQLNITGTYAENNLKVTNGKLQVSGVGDALFSLNWNLKKGLESIDAKMASLNANGVYSLFLKPFTDKTNFNQLIINGLLDIDFLYEENQVKKVDVALKDVTLTDQDKRFSLNALNAHIPWHYDQETDARIYFASAQLLDFPIGELDVPIKMHGLNFVVDEIAVPMVDGKLLIRNFVAAKAEEGWQWQFNGVLLPISMEAITKALKVPVMRGNLSATIPSVIYRNGTMTVEGGIGIRVFNGDIGITQVKLIDPLGNAAQFYADVEMRNLDLGLVTSTFKFGSIEGRIDVDAKNMELFNWKPVKLDARVESSPGRYRKKISQQAVENISSLGGAGAVAAIQRSVLRFFKEFGYEKLGLACRLRNDVCEMSGIEDTSNGYLIVKGGGIPAMTVKGYNRYVGWNELIQRLSRITQTGSYSISQ